MRRNDDLEARLVEWGKEYGGGKYQDIGWQGISPIHTLMTYHGPAPQGLVQVSSKYKSPADFVEEAVAKLQIMRSGYRPAMVVRIEYTLPGQPVISKLQKLSRIGIDLHQNRSRYSQLLSFGRSIIATHLGLPFDEVDERYAEAIGL